MIFILLILNLWAEPVAIQSLKSTDFEYETYLNRHPQVRSWIQNFKSQKTSAQQSLYQELKKAQFEFMSGQLDQAKIHFNKISDLKHQSDWPSEDRKVIHYALLRLSQLTEDPLLKNQRLGDAIDFDSSFKIDEKLFPPPMVEKLKNLKKMNLSKVWSLPKNAAEFDEVLVNGKSLKGRISFLRSSPSRKRFTFLSNKYQAVTLIQEPQHLESSTLLLKPIALGDCDNPSWQTELNPSQKWLLVDGGCVGESKNQSLLSSTTTRGEILEPIKDHSPRDLPRLLKSKWFWIGVSVLAAGVVVSQNQKQSPQNTPPPQVQVFRNR